MLPSYLIITAFVKPRSNQAVVQNVLVLNLKRQQGFGVTLNQHGSRAKGSALRNVSSRFMQIRHKFAA